MFGLPIPLLKLLTNPVVGWILAICAAIASYAGVFFAGEHKDAKSWEAKIAVYEKQLKENADDTAEKIKSLNEVHQVELAAIQSRLEKAEKRKAYIQTIIKEVPKYVTAKADAECTITMGFVWVYNGSLLPELPEATRVSFRQPVDADIATSLKASDVAATAADNNAECVARGEVINEWQQWYVKSKAEWDEFKSSIPDAPKIPK